MTANITSFSGYYHFLSNFYASPIYIKGKVYRTVEHAYQVAKHTDPVFQEEIRLLHNPGAVKKLARSRPCRENWDMLKCDVMWELLRMKFAIPNFAVALLETGDAHLVEGNTWGDQYWGVCNGKGLNMLGALLMKVRDEIRETPTRIALKAMLNPASVKCGDQDCSHYRNMEGGCDLCGAPCL